MSHPGPQGHLACYLCLSLRYCHVCFLQPCGHLLGKANLLALLYVMFFVFLSLSHAVSWIRLYRFLIFVPFVTLFRYKDLSSL